MTKLRYLLYLVIAIPVLLFLIWMIAIPADLIRDRIESAVTNTGNSNLKLSIKGFRKGLFCNLYADSLDLSIDDKPALRITGFRSTFNPGYLTKKELALSIKGKIGTGDINGLLKLPLDGRITIEKAELDAISFLSQFGVKIKGYVFSDITIKNNFLTVAFKVPDLDIDDSDSVIPLLNTFHRLQGSLSIENNIIKITSISLEGDKGYARLKGDIANRRLNLSLELMPDENKLSTGESMLIGRYIVSPGYYVIPIRKRL
ncbi:MAG: type II secretion system protein GspN [Nitrospirota bacterium]